MKSEPTHKYVKVLIMVLPFFGLALTMAAILMGNPWWAGGLGFWAGVWTKNAAVQYLEWSKL